MKNLKNLGIASIMSGFLIGCSSGNFATKLFQKNTSDNKIFYVQEKGFDRMEFVPGKNYYLNSSLKGNYVITTLASNENFPKVSVTYFTQTGRVYQQALFSYEPKTKEMVANVVEIDWDSNGIRDMILHYDLDMKKLVLMRQHAINKNMNSYFSNKALDDYFSTPASSNDK